MTSEVRMLSPIHLLVGVWRGGGKGEFPTMDPFDYQEEIRFIDIGAPPLVYQQRAWSPSTDEPLHVETGIWRSSAEGQMAITIALPRVSEISEGTIEAGRIRLLSTSVRRAAGGSGLVCVRREYDIDGDEIAYHVWMSTEGVTELTHHLHGSLSRVVDSG